MDDGLVIVPAGAGAGKTFHIKTQLADWVSRNIVKPERILAVTYTEAAAAELRDRIRGALLASGSVTGALAVERGYVTTIHGLGLRLLSEHALAAGASPMPTVLDEAGRGQVIRQVLAHARAFDPIRKDPARFGYSANFYTGASVEDAMRGAVLGMIDLLNGLGERGRDPSLIKPACGRLAEIYGPTLADPDVANDTLVSAVAAMLADFPQGGMETVTAKTPRATLEGDLALFRRLQADPGLASRDWALWQKLRKLFTSNRNSRTPEGYDARAEAIMTAADALPEHPGPLKDAQLHLRCLITCAQEVMKAWDASKRALGVIDFSDMITTAENLLRTDPAVRRAVLDEIDCVVIDEFQDTNPIQFALLWQLGRHAPRSLLVGDAKQSIMGFQGSDPRLSQALARANPGTVRPLENNWRSTPEVMQFVNALGTGLFGDDYTALIPQRASIPGPAVELLRVAHRPSQRKYSKPCEHTAERITRIVTDGETVTDPKTGALREARWADIALLVCRHTTASRYATELRARGVPVRITENGWMDSPAVQAARAALSYVANPEDIHAGLVLRVLGPEPLMLETALRQQIDRQLADDPVLMRLAALASEVAQMPVSTALDHVIAAIGLDDWAAAQADGGQARADLLRLMAEAQAFETSPRELRATAGFHGDGIKVFLAWLDSRMQEKDFDQRPDPSSGGTDAVEITTWHSAKGREWPITVVTEFDYGIEEREGNNSLHFFGLDDVDDMNSVLASTQIIHTPRLVAAEAMSRFIEDRRPNFESNARSLLYVALTRARDRLILEWPDFLEERDEGKPAGSCLFHVLEDCCRPILSTDSLTIAGVSCPAIISPQPDIASFTDADASVAATDPRPGHPTPMAPVTLTPWRIQPSRLASAETPATRRVNIGPVWDDKASTAERGTALHLAMQTFLLRSDLTGPLARATGLDDAILARIEERAEALKRWLAAEGFPDLRCEIPVMGSTAAGSEISGTIDLLAAGPRGTLLVDHKSGGAGQGLGPYWPQLQAYARIVRDLFPDQPLLAAAVFWLDHGVLEVVDRPIKLHDKIRKGEGRT